MKSHNRSTLGKQHHSTLEWLKQQVWTKVSEDCNKSGRVPLGPSECEQKNREAGIEVGGRREGGRITWICGQRNKYRERHKRGATLTEYKFKYINSPQQKKRKHKRRKEQRKQTGAWRQTCEGKQGKCLHTSTQTHANSDHSNRADIWPRVDYG